MEFIIQLHDEKATTHFGENLAHIFKRGDLVTLYGNLGVGKSTLARAIIRALSDNASLDVPSPTFTLIQTYENKRFPVTHADLYRIKSPREIEELGLEHALEEGLLIVEWPEKAEGLLNNAQFAIFLKQSNTSCIATVKVDKEASKRLRSSSIIQNFLL